MHNIDFHKKMVYASIVGTSTILFTSAQWRVPYDKPTQQT